MGKKKKKRKETKHLGSIQITIIVSHKRISVNEHFGRQNGARQDLTIAESLRSLQLEASMAAEGIRTFSDPASHDKDLREQ